MNADNQNIHVHHESKHFGIFTFNLCRGGSSELGMQVL